MENMMKSYDVLYLTVALMALVSYMCLHTIEKKPNQFKWWLRLLFVGAVILTTQLVASMF